MASRMHNTTKNAPATLIAQLFLLLVGLALFGIVFVVVGVIAVIGAVIGAILLGSLFLIFMCVRVLALQIVALGKAAAAPATSSRTQKRWLTIVLKLCVRQLIPLLLWCLWQLWSWTWSATAGASSPRPQPQRTSFRTLSG